MVLPYVLQQELNNVDHLSLMLRKCDHPYQRSVNVQTSWRTTLSLFMSVCQRVNTVLLFRLTRYKNTDEEMGSNVMKNQPMLPLPVMYILRMTKTFDMKTVARKI